MVFKNFCTERIINKDEPVIFMLTENQINSLMNPLSEEIFESIFTATRNHLYLDFSYSETAKKIDVFLKPYYLLFYDNEWYLLGAEEDESGNEKYSWFASRKIDYIYRRKEENLFQIKILIWIILCRFLQRVLDKF